MRISDFCFSGSPFSIMPYERTPRTPAFSTARATSSIKKYWSAKQVVPDFIISRQPSKAPTYTCSPVRCFSIGQISSSNHGLSGMSSAMPRSRVIERWVWALINPGKTAFPRASITTSAGSRRSSPRAEILSPSTATEPRLRIRRLGSIVIT